MSRVAGESRRLSEVCMATTTDMAACRATIARVSAEIRAIESNKYGIDRSKLPGLIRERAAASERLLGYESDLKAGVLRPAHGGLS